MVDTKIKYAILVIILLVAAYLVLTQLGLIKFQILQNGALPAASSSGGSVGGAR